MKKSGITLISLVVTIIVLLILAGITINLTIGQRGILTRAKEAGRNYQEAARKEDEDLTKFLGEADRIVDEISGKYTMVDEVPVPKGFEHVTGTTKEDGFVIRDNSGTVTNGNEYVWIPCSMNGANGSIQYDRYVLLPEEERKNEATGEIIQSYDGQDDGIYIEELSEIERKSIEQYGGFYIGRYEVGVENGVLDKEEVVVINGYEVAPSESWTGWKNGMAVVKKNKQVYNYITKAKAQEIAENMYQSNDAIISRLCSSYAWDTTLKFIETEFPNYLKNSSQGNYKNTTFHYTDLNGNGQVKEEGNSILVPTGQTTEVKNIYDMGGNAWEWTTEICTAYGGSSPTTIRGGMYNWSSSILPTAARAYFDTTDVAEDTSFRQTLYIK